MKPSNDGNLGTRASDGKLDRRTIKGRDAIDTLPTAELKRMEREGTEPQRRWASDELARRIGLEPDR